MANVFFDPGKQRATKVKALFGQIAPRYDLINDLQSFGLHRYWKRRLVLLAAPQPGERALDLCCGTGDLAFALTQRGVEVVGLDFSQQMLGVAKSKAQSPKSKVERSWPKARGPQSEIKSELSEAIPQSPFRTPRFVQGDAQQLPFRADSFDIVTVGYGLRNLADWEIGLREMQRVTRPGGRLLVLDFGKPNNSFWRSLYFGYLRFFVPVLGRIFCGDAAAYGYILESLKHYPAQQGVARQMEELGLVQTRLMNLLGGVMSINYSCKA
jgi:demethylmenaquinone methyltransferase/2-methoxy-6-polyprenyl-1,4-benzoquinol methylase